MNPHDAKRFSSVTAVLRDGRGMRLRPLLAADGELLAAFYAAVPPQDYFFYCPHPLDREHALANAAAADNPREVALVAEAADGTIAGFASYRWKDEQAAVSKFGICVRPDCQGAGLGRLLMARLLEIASQIGPATMALTVQKANPRAVALYEKMGFSIVREQLRQRDQEPEYYMERPCR